MVLIEFHSTGIYKLYNPKTNKVMISRDVMVKEAESWNWGRNVEETREIDHVLNAIEKNNTWI